MAPDERKRLWRNTATSAVCGWPVGEAITVHTTARRSALLGATALWATTVLAVPRRGAAAQEQAAAWPTRPVRIVVPFPAGGTTDLLARILTEPLTARLGQPVIVENRPGAGGNIGADAVAKASDGHTLLMTTIGTAAIICGLYRNTMHYRPEVPAAVSEVAAVPNGIVA